ncbi:MAG: hypothetical protein ACRERS_02600 [Methylococcales bacterium]
MKNTCRSLNIRYLLLLLLPVQMAVAASGLPTQPACSERPDIAIWISPRDPEAARSFKVMLVNTKAALSEFTMTDPDGRLRPLDTIERGGPPWSATARIDYAKPGIYRFEALQNGKVASCREVNVGRVNQSGYRGWNEETEAFFSAWIEQLFDAPLDEDLSFSSLDPVLRNDRRNFLHNYLGLAEDNALVATPDCADLPYLLRAYFAWKIGLPMSYHGCNRGNPNRPPDCPAFTLTERIPNHSVGSFNAYVRQLFDGVHSGNGRTALDDDHTDFYPVELRREYLRPGTLYADPYGHTLVIVKWVPQTQEHSGLLLAVDAQPDNSVTRKRFWEGTFLYSNDVPGAGPGFKNFRPLVTTENGRSQLLPNLSLAMDQEFIPYDIEQANLNAENFYARMSNLINPAGLEPAKAYEAMLDALMEQLETRVTSVDNGEQYMRGHSGSVVSMPDGAAIFETSGPWEDYATPSRDLRLIIAINVLQSLAQRIVRYPELFKLDDRKPEIAKAEVETLHEQRTQERGITYTRSDGTAMRLRVADILARKTALEMAYNPNDCIEIRWGAAQQTEDYAACRRHAPVGQRAKMEQYRDWFRYAKRPSR